MKRFYRAALILFAAGLALSVPRARATAAQATPAYDVFAVRFATVSYPVASLVQGAERGRRIDIAFTVWLLRGGGRTILFDAGFYREKFLAQWKPAGFTTPAQAIANGLGVKADEISDIIISHSHWDHADGVDLFPRARVWIQKDEYEYYVGPNGDVLHTGGVDADDAKVLAGLNAAGRLSLVDGDGKEILPGVTVYTGGKHTFGSQFAGVATRTGVVVLVSDNVYLYENLEKHAPIAQTLDARSNLAAQDRMVAIAGSVARVVPGHDPAVFARFPEVTAGVVQVR